jgi:hypothetical protein
MTTHIVLPYGILGFILENPIKRDSSMSSGRASREIASERGTSLKELVGAIDAARNHANGRPGISCQLAFAWPQCHEHPKDHDADSRR